MAKADGWFGGNVLEQLKKFGKLGAELLHLTWR
jgi:hypothetical protein